MVPKHFFLGIILSLSASIASAQEILILTPYQDAAIGYHDGHGSAYTNYNSSISFSAFSQPGNLGGVNVGRGLMKFDLSDIPSGTTILGAFLTLHAAGPVGSSGTVLTIGHVGINTSKLSRVTTPWSDNTVTWNTAPSTTTMNEVSLPMSSYALQDYLNINVTALVQDMVNAPSSSHGFMIKLDNETPSRGLLFHSSEGTNSTQHPTLTIVFGACPGSPGTMATEDGSLADDLHSTQQSFLWPNVIGKGGIQIFSTDRTNGRNTVRVLDVSGKLLFERLLSRHEGSFSEIGRLPSGKYIAQLIDEDGALLATQTTIVQ